MQTTLFASHTDQYCVEEFQISDGTLRLITSALASEHCSQLLNTLIDSIPWQQDVIRIAGRQLPVPRLQCWMGDPHSHYHYSGIRFSPRPWAAPVQELRHWVESLSGHQFNSVLLNYYRNGRDSVSWHADNEPELGPAPVIASLSLGAARPFQLRHQTSGQRLRLELADGSLLIMGDTVQRHWQHQLPKVKGLLLPRVNLTFRYIH